MHIEITSEEEKNPAGTFVTIVAKCPKCSFEGSATVINDQHRMAEKKARQQVLDHIASEHKND